MHVGQWPPDDEGVQYTDKVNKTEEVQNFPCVKRCSCSLEIMREAFLYSCVFNVGEDESSVFRYAVLF